MTDFNITMWEVYNTNNPIIQKMNIPWWLSWASTMYQESTNTFILPYNVMFWITFIAILGLTSLLIMVIEMLFKQQLIKLESWIITEFSKGVTSHNDTETDDNTK